MSVFKKYVIEVHKYYYYRHSDGRFRYKNVPTTTDINEAFVYSSIYQAEEKAYAISANGYPNVRIVECEVVPTGISWGKEHFDL